MQGWSASSFTTVILSTNMIVDWGTGVELGDSQVLVDPFDPNIFFQTKSNL